jgi:oligoendopeptidase F
MFEKLRRIISNKLNYSPATQETIDALSKRFASVENIEETKSTEGWKEIESRIKNEIKLSIVSLLQEDKTERAGRINALLQLLSSVNVSDTKKEMEQIIETMFPE